MVGPAWKDWKGCLSSCLFLFIFVYWLVGCTSNKVRFTSLALMVVIDLLQIVPLLVRSQHVVQRTHSIWQNLEAPAPTRSMRCGRGSWCHTACGARFRSCFLGPFPLGLLGRFFSKNSWGELGSNCVFFFWPGLPKPLPYTVFWVQTPRIPRLSRSARCSLRPAWAVPWRPPSHPCGAQQPRARQSLAQEAQKKPNLPGEVTGKSENL